MLSFLGLLLLISSSNAHSLYPPKGSVVELTSTNFDKLVIQSEEVWVVEYFAPWCGHCQSLVPEYTLAANALKGVVKVGAVDVDDFQDLGRRFAVKSFPMIKIFGRNKRNPEDYNGEKTAKGIANAALTAVKTKVKHGLNAETGYSKGSSSSTDDVVELTAANFDKLVLKSDDIWLVEFFAPWCGHCKNLAPQWAKAATELKGKVKLGALDATVHQAKASQYDVQGYPTIKYFPAGKKSQSSAENYNGGRTSSEIVSWALEKFAENILAPEVTQIINQDGFETTCQKKTLCVVSILPHIYDCQSKCRNDYVKMLTKLGEEFKKRMWGWVWSEAGSQPELEKTLDIGGFGYPAMAVINAKKMKYSILRGAFSKQGIHEFLRDLSYGKGPGKGNTASVKAIPRIREVESWDGKDAKLPEEVYDDFDTKIEL